MTTDKEQRSEAVPRVRVVDMSGDGSGPWRLFVGEYGVADWPWDATEHHAREYADEVARCLNVALAKEQRPAEAPPVSNWPAPTFINVDPDVTELDSDGLCFEWHSGNDRKVTLYARPYMVLRDYGNETAERGEPMAERFVEWLGALRRERAFPMEESCASDATGPVVPKAPVKIAEPKRSPVVRAASPAASAMPSVHDGSGLPASDVYTLQDQKDDEYTQLVPPRCTVCGASRLVKDGRPGVCSLVPGGNGKGGCKDPLHDVRKEQRPSDAETTSPMIQNGLSEVKATDNACVSMAIRLARFEAFSEALELLSNADCVNDAIARVSELRSAAKPRAVPRTAEATPVWHYMPKPGVANCGADYPNMSKTATIENATCVACLRIAARPDPVPGAIRAFFEGADVPRRERAKPIDDDSDGGAEVALAARTVLAQRERAESLYRDARDHLAHLAKLVGNVNGSPEITAGLVKDLVGR